VQASLILLTAKRLGINKKDRRLPVPIFPSFPQLIASNGFIAAPQHVFF
jgi:hypothetical protein